MCGRWTPPRERRKWKAIPWPIGPAVGAGGPKAVCPDGRAQAPGRHTPRNPRGPGWPTRVIGRVGWLLPSPRSRRLSPRKTEGPEHGQGPVPRGGLKGEPELPKAC
eukprot:3247527-Lingulodinium_polyedra.AAC.1